MRLGGLFNVYNSLAAIGVGVVLGLGAEEIKAGLEAVKAVAGRFESVDCGQDFGVIVDYAHTPDGLENVLRSAREIAGNRLLVVFGCGGDRDRAKRPIMGRIASELADVCHRHFGQPAQRGARKRSSTRCSQGSTAAAGPPSRSWPTAVTRSGAPSVRPRRATSSSSPARGTKTYQIFRDRTIHFDDREVVRDLLGCKP